MLHLLLSSIAAVVLAQDRRTGVTLLQCDPYGSSPTPPPTPPLCVGLDKGDVTEGQKFHMMPCSPLLNTLLRYNIDEDENIGTLEFVSDGGTSKKCVVLGGGDMINGNQIEVWDCNNMSNQNWRYGQCAFLLICSPFAGAGSTRS